MDKFREKLNECQQKITNICNMIEMRQIPCNSISYNELYNALYDLVPLIPKESRIFRDRLRDKILPNLKLQDIVSINPFGQKLVTPQNGINPFVFGQVIATIAYLNEFAGSKEIAPIWNVIHPQIVSVAKSRYDDGYYADAVEAAFKEINSRVKKIYKERTSIEKDGNKLMTAAFSVQNPIIKLGDISTETGHNIQQGYMEMFSGAMIGIRNPKAHNNQTISQADAVRKLNFASMLMYKLDNEIK